MTEEERRKQEERRIKQAVTDLRVASQAQTFAMQRESCISPAMLMAAAELIEDLEHQLIDFRNGHGPTAVELRARMWREERGR